MEQSARWRWTRPTGQPCTWGRIIFSAPPFATTHEQSVDAADTRATVKQRAGQGWEGLGYETDKPRSPSFRLLWSPFASASPPPLHVRFTSTHLAHSSTTIRRSFGRRGGERLSRQRQRQQPARPHRHTSGATSVAPNAHSSAPPHNPHLGCNLQAVRITRTKGLYA